MGAAAALAAATCAGLKAFEVGFNLRAVRIATRDKLSGVLPLGPHHKNDPTAANCQASQPQFAVVIAIIFYRDHRGIERILQLGEVYPMFPEIKLSLGLVPGDHTYNVDAF